MYFREYLCSFSTKSYYFYISGVSHLKVYLSNSAERHPGGQRPYIYNMCMAMLFFEHSVCWLVGVLSARILILVSSEEDNLSPSL